MKFKGKTLGKRNTDILVLLRGTERIVIKAQAVESFEDFDKLVSAPVPPEVIEPGGKKSRNMKDLDFIKARDAYANQKTAWLVINSLKATEEIEWENVKYDIPSTWTAWDIELKEAGFIETECMRIIQLVAEVNSLDDDMLEQARQAFLLETLQAKK